MLIIVERDSKIQYLNGRKTQNEKKKKKRFPFS